MEQVPSLPCWEVPLHTLPVPALGSLQRSVMEQLAAVAARGEVSAVAASSPQQYLKGTSLSAELRK